MNTTRHVMLLSALLGLGCQDATLEDTDPVETDEPAGTTTDDEREGPEVQLPEITGLAVDCIDPDQAVLQPYYRGSLVADTWVVDMANTSIAPNHGYEIHEFIATEADTLQLVTRSDYVSGVSTTFLCSEGLDMDEAELGEQMTYILRAYADDELVGCGALGHDPIGMLDGSYATDDEWRPWELATPACAEIPLDAVDDESTL